MNNHFVKFIDTSGHSVSYQILKSVSASAHLGGSGDSSRKLFLSPTWNKFGFLVPVLELGQPEVLQAFEEETSNWRVVCLPRK